MSFGYMDRLESLFRFQGAARMVLILADGPMRTAEVCRILAERHGIYRPATAVRRSLDHAVSCGQVECIANGDHNIYRLTDAGRRDAALITALAAVSTDG